LLSLGARRRPVWRRCNGSALVYFFGYNLLVLLFDCNRDDDQERDQ
jgi:hypothetical protein